MMYFPIGLGIGFLSLFVMAAIFAVTEALIKKVANFFTEDE